MRDKEEKYQKEKADQIAKIADLNERRLAELEAKEIEHQKTEIRAGFEK
jgi:hypothetical protein